MQPRNVRARARSCLRGHLTFTCLSSEGWKHGCGHYIAVHPGHLARLSRTESLQKRTTNKIDCRSRYCKLSNAHPPNCTSNDCLKVRLQQSQSICCLTVCLVLRSRSYRDDNPDHSGLLRSLRVLVSGRRLTSSVDSLSDQRPILSFTRISFRFVDCPLLSVHYRCSPRFLYIRSYITCTTYAWSAFASLSIYFPLSNIFRRPRIIRTPFMLMFSTTIINYCACCIYHLTARPTTSLSTALY